MRAKTILSTLSTKPVLSAFSEEALKVGDPHYMVVLTCVDAIHLCMRCTLIERGLMEIVCIMLCSENGLHELRTYGYSNSPNAIPILLFQ